MSEYERSYYEIALTNGQVLTVFGTLLAVVFGAFVSGMWVAGRAIGEAPAPVVSSAAADEPVSDGEGGDGVDEGPVRFFAEPTAVTPQDPGQQVVDPSADRPQEPSTQPVASVGATEAEGGAPAQSGRQGSASFEPQADAPSTPSAAAGERAAEQAATRRAEQAAAAERDAASRPAPQVDVPQVSDLPVIQVLSSGDEGQAQQLLRRLKGAGHRAFISPVQVDGRTMYRVRVGPFTERSQAEREAAVLKREFKLDTWITTN